LAEFDWLSEGVQIAILSVLFSTIKSGATQPITLFKSTHAGFYMFWVNGGSFF